MSAPAPKLELSDQARRIIQQEGQALAALAEGGRAQRHAAADAIEGVCQLLNQRGRYSSITAEHFDRQDYEGIQIIDALDEQAAKAGRSLLKEFVDAHKRTPDLKALQFVTERLKSAFLELPEYPVAYMALGALRASIASFQKLAEVGAGFELPALEHALVHFLLGVIDKYVQTRERPVERHKSDIQRQYVVVRRMKCRCGEEKFEVTMQALCHTPEGAPFDRLELACRACSARRTITFDLPYFKDLARM